MTHAYEGYVTLWLNIKKPSISTNQIARNQEFGMSTLHTKGQTPKAVVLQNAYMAFKKKNQGDGLSNEVWIGQEWKPRLWSRGRHIYIYEK